MTLTIEEYLGRHAETEAAELTDDIKAAAADTVAKINAFLAECPEQIYVNTGTGSILNSGWRPASYNAHLRQLWLDSGGKQGAPCAVNSRHSVGEAADLFDPYGKIDEWCMNNQAVLEKIGLWLEHPDSTPHWCHLQTVAPRSGSRVFRV